MGVYLVSVGAEEWFDVALFPRAAQHSIRRGCPIVYT
jgi:hypothetical protein